MDMKRYENVLRKQTGKAVRPYRADGYVNLINKYGTRKDDTEMYFFQPEPPVDDALLEMFYENNGLFAKIIDTPAEEALKHGFELKDISDDEIIKFYQSALDELDWVEVAMQGIKWARLFGGSIAIMLINDGRGLEDPVDGKHIKCIDDIVVFDRSMIVPDRSSIYVYDSEDPFRTRGSRLGTPEWYEITSPTGTFVVHDSRCLTFRNGILPLNTTNENYQLWGVPEYVRISRAIRNAEVAHESAPKMLSKSIQPVYKMKDLAMELATVEGEDKVLRRLQAIDMARGLLNSITIDAEGEDYSFQTFGFAGVAEVIDASCNWLSALTNIPQTILFGRSPAGMNATGQSDFENYYNFVERIQQRMIRSNLRYLLSIIFTAGKHTGEISYIPEIDIEFNPLWSMSETEEVQLEAAKIQNELARASVAEAYVGMQVIDPSEVRKELGKEDPIDPETMLNDMTEEELMETMPQGQQGGMGGMGDMGGMMGGAMPQMPSEQAPEASEMGSEQGGGEDYAMRGNSPESAPEATKLPQDMNEEDPDREDDENETTNPEDLDWITMKNGVHIPLDSNGKAVGGPVDGEEFTGASSASNKAVNLNESAKNYLKEYKDNPMLFGKSFDEKEKLKAAFEKELKDSGFEVKTLEKDGYEYKLALTSEMPYEELAEINRALNQSYYLYADLMGEYIKACENDGVAPKFHQTPEQVSPYMLYSSSGKLQSDGTPVYTSFNTRMALSNDEIVKYSMSIPGLNEEGADKINKSAQDAIGKMSGDERAAIKQYTKQWGTGNYQDVNHYLATGEGDEKVKEAATLVTSALEHPVGNDCIVSRGDDTVFGAGNDAAIKKMIGQIEKGNFSNAQKLKDALMGKTVSVPVALSTTPGEALEGFNRRPVQFIFKTPANAKGVKIDQLSVYGEGASEAEKKLAATGLFGTKMAESEVLFKPGLRYKIDDVNFVGEKDGKKKKGQVYITATILADNEDQEPDHEDSEENSLISAHGTELFEAPVRENTDSEAVSWLIKDTDAVMSGTSDLNSLEWLDDEIKRRIRGVGVLVVDKNGKILSGIRRNGDGEKYGLLGGPGGHIEPGESFEDAAIRETYEEFGIVPKDLTFIALGDYEEESGMIPAIFLCTEWAGTVHPIDGEMDDVRFRNIDDILSYNLFDPFKNSLEILEIVLTKDEDSDIIYSDEGEDEDDTRLDGNRSNLARVTIAKAISEGFDANSEENKEDTLDKAIAFLEDKGISKQDIKDEWQSKRKESMDRQKDVHKEKKKEQEKKENDNTQKKNEYQQNLSDAQAVYNYKNNPSQSNSSQNIQANISKDEVLKRAFDSIKLDYNGGAFPPVDQKYQKHVIQQAEPAFAGMSKKQYRKYAEKLAQSKVGGNIKGFTRNDGDYIRYDTDKNVIVIVNGNTKKIRSCHMLRESHYLNVIPGGITGRAYYEYQKMEFGWR